MKRPVNPEPTRSEAVHASALHPPSAGDDTIAAIATAPGEAGIAIVRVSGPDALSIADRIFVGRGSPPSSLPGGTFHYGHAQTPGSDAGADARTAASLDEVILLIFRSPRSFTGEDTAEFQCHGGRSCSQRVLRAAIEAGARLADPGEFTRRAFMNGRIDLLQAEAVLDLIKARTDAASSAALSQLDGTLSKWAQDNYNSIISTLADVEASLDFGDDEVGSIDTRRLKEELERIDASFVAMLGTWSHGRLVRDGAKVVIAGQPNSGKSTLMNRLVGLDRSIVSEHPGTTRDVVEEQIVVDGYLVVLSDTAGLRDSPCAIEQDGIRRAKRRIEQADLVLYVLDATLPLGNDDMDTIRTIGPERCIAVLNKSDLGVAFDPKTIADTRHIACSAKNGTNLPELASLMITALGLRAGSENQVSISARHRACLSEALRRIREARDMLISGDESVLVPVASSLRQALEQLDSMTGRYCSDEVLDSVFSKFCIGK